MRSTLIALAGLCATLVSAAGLPSCASSCVTTFGSCGQFDVKCICSSTTLIAGLACCVSTSCDAADQDATIDFANALCAGQGVTDLPQSATCAPGASTGVPTTTATSLAAAISSAAAQVTGTSTTSTSTGTTGNAAAPTARAVEKLGLGVAVAGLLAVL